MYKQKITIYRCSFCGKHYHSSSGCLKHEEKCLFDPIKKACGSCIFSEYGFSACGLTGKKLNTKSPVKKCKDHKTIEEHEDEVDLDRSDIIEECRR